MASPRLEDGFTCIPNDLLDAIFRFHCSGGQKSIIHAVIRNTYGYHHTERELSITYIAKITALNTKTVKEHLATLLKKKVLLEIAPATFTRGRILAVNTNFEEWEGILPRTVRKKSEWVGMPRVNEKGVSVNSPTGGENTYPQGVNSLTPQGVR